MSTLSPPVSRGPQNSSRGTRSPGPVRREETRLFLLLGQQQASTANVLLAQPAANIFTRKHRCWYNPRGGRADSNNMSTSGRPLLGARGNINDVGFKHVQANSSEPLAGLSRGFILCKWSPLIFYFCPIFLNEKKYFGDKL